MADEETTVEITRLDKIDTTVTVPFLSSGAL